MTARNVLFGTLLLGMCALLASGLQAPTETKSAAPAKAVGAKEEHSAMLKEHKQAHDEHDTALAQLGKWRFEHRRASPSTRDELRTTNPLTSPASTTAAPMR